MKRIIVLVGISLGLALAPIGAAAPVAVDLCATVGIPVSAGATGSELYYRGCGGVHVPVQSATDEQAVAQLVNQERAARGLPPLKVVWELAEAARYHAADMAQDNYFQHDSYDGSRRVCAWDQRVASFYPNHQSMAENIAAGYGTPTEAMAAWMNSGGHRDNILSASNWEIGIGYYSGSGSYGVYWVQDLGRRTGQYPLVIDSEAASTDSANVSLYLYGDWDEVRLCNDGGAWSNWRPFANTTSWTLTSAVGERTVMAEMRSGTRTAAAQDTIWLTKVRSELGDLPDQLVFLASASEQRVTPGAYVVILQNALSNTPLNWRATKNVDWLTLSQATGTTPGSLWIAFQGPAPSGPQTLHGKVRVELTAPADAAGTPQEINVVLHVAPGALQLAYLPYIAR